jgi:hypothetical protein
VRLKRRRWHHQIQLEDQLTETSAMTGYDPASFTQTLKDYAKDFSDTALGKDVIRVIDEQPTWAGAVAWAKAVEAWTRAGPLLVDEPQTAAARAKECQRILTDYPSFPDTKLVGDYQSYLEAVARREGLARRNNGKSIGVRADLESVWNEKFATKLQVVQTDDGERYYFVDPPKVLGTALKFRCYIDFEEANTKEVSIPKARMKPVDWTPQCTIAAKVNGENLLQKSSWEEANLAILRDLCEPQRYSKVPFDPIYQFYLIKTTAELAAEGSHPLESTLKPLLNAVAQAGIDTTVFWMKPDDAAANTERRKADDFVRKLPSLARAKAEVQQYRQRLNRQLARQRIPVGRLAREGTAWCFRSAHPLRAGTDLWVANPAEGGPAAWQNIGTARAEAPGLNSASAGARAWIEGRPVFADIPSTVPAR